MGTGWPPKARPIQTRLSPPVLVPLFPFSPLLTLHDETEAHWQAFL